MNSTAPRYDAFISYRHLHPDMDVAMKLQKLLESYRPPGSLGTSGRKKLRIFTDKTELPLKSDLGEGIRTALQNSDFLIVVCSPETQHSKWCLEEIRYFKELHNGSADRILVVLAAGTPDTALFYELTHTLTVPADGRDTPQEREIEPLCSNVAAETAAWSLRLLNREFLRIAAPILGCGYDDLVRRGRKRRQRNLALGSAAAVLLLAAGVLSAYALKEKNDQVQRQQAVISDQTDRITEQINQSTLDGISLECAGIESDVKNGRKALALGRIAALWSAYEDGPYAGEVLKSLAELPLLANYTERFGTWSAVPVSDGCAMGVSEDGNTVALCGIPSDGQITVYLYDGLLNARKNLTLSYDSAAPVKLEVKNNLLEFTTYAGERLSYDFEGAYLGRRTEEANGDEALYLQAAQLFEHLGRFDHPSQRMYGTEGGTVALLYSDPSSPMYDPYESGGFAVYSRETGERASFPIPSPDRFGAPGMFCYDGIVPVPGRDIVLISAVQGVYASCITAYSTRTGEELFTVDIEDAAVNLREHCSFSALEYGWVLLHPGPAGDRPPYIAYFSLSEEPGYNRTYGKRLMNTYGSTYVNCLAVGAGTLFVLTDNNLQALSLCDLSLTDSLAGIPSPEAYHSDLRRNPLAGDEGKVLSAADQRLTLKKGIVLQSTAIPWHYGDTFYTGVQLQLNLLDAGGNHLFSLLQTDMSQSPYLSEEDEVFGFVSYDTSAPAVLLPLKNAEDIVKDAAALPRRDG